MPSVIRRAAKSPTRWSMRCKPSDIFGSATLRTFLASCAGGHAYAIGDSQCHKVAEPPVYECHRYGTPWHRADGFRLERPAILVRAGQRLGDFAALQITDGMHDISLRLT
jgi:hypothetical protein